MPQVNQGIEDIVLDGYVVLQRGCGIDSVVRPQRWQGSCHWATVLGLPFACLRPTIPQRCVLSSQSMDCAHTIGSSEQSTLTMRIDSSGKRAQFGDGQWVKLELAGPRGYTRWVRDPTRPLRLTNHHHLLFPRPHANARSRLISNSSTLQTTLSYSHSYLQQSTQSTQPPQPPCPASRTRRSANDYAPRKQKKMVTEGIVHASTRSLEP